ncbi:hypothetical protein [Colwellia sp. Bg11-28]|nr:hypothetical protein [Colwellia sp. Bg11-28]
MDEFDSFRGKEKVKALEEVCLKEYLVAESFKDLVATFYGGM